ncbi:MULTISPECIES: ABC transporter ATP-binding protein [Pseudomonas]|jgi:putative ABC transport system ATP-binding protein|uniref:ABC transporter ATP-binding protein n=1 Tax=Pseudomonas kielensis TaxID=2762577 RepID=A0A7X1L108_9PSED|nr:MULTISPECIES: ABC transporter ATP-binding protein [Pseudomonas]MBC2693476.1 ABC transporter ATP-binding protein [Pseudomonas kielensis]
MTVNYAIHAENLSMVYGRGPTRVEALKGVELAVRPGDLWAIMGPSGSGKTTLLTILGLVTTPTGGSLRIDGENIYDGKQPDLARLRREKIGFIFQSPNLIPFLTVSQNVLLPLHLAGVRGQHAEARVRELLGYLDIADRADLHPNQLSGGEQQRVAIARALANNPKIILADEPTASLDTERALNVMRLLRQVTNEQHAAVLVVTHDHRLIKEVDRVVQVIDGRIVDAISDAPTGAQEPSRGPER